MVCNVHLRPMVVVALLAVSVPVPLALARKADPIPPPAAPISDAVTLSRVPLPLLQREGLQLVLDRRHRQLLVLENGMLRRRYPAAVGTVGWETPAGSFQVLEKQAHPVWEHPGNGRRVRPGGPNPLGSRWIGFARNCNPRRAWDGERYLSVAGCTVAGFHGTPHRWTVGRAVSHGCVRLYEEDVQELFELVQVGTPVTVLP
jgi:L,D-transpeptidase ErfK/SrfK